MNFTIHQQVVGPTQRLQTGVGVLVLLALATLANCGTKSPTGPTPPTPCMTGVQMTVNVLYRRDPNRTRPDSISVPTLTYQYFNGGKQQFAIVSKVDYYTWTAVITVPANVNGPSHQIHVFDGATIPPATSSVTASGLFVNNVQVFKGTSQSGALEYGFFRIDGCNVVTAVR